MKKRISCEKGASGKSTSAAASKARPLARLSSSGLELWLCATLYSTTVSPATTEKERDSFSAPLMRLCHQWPWPSPGPCSPYASHEGPSHASWKVGTNFEKSTLKSSVFLWNRTILTYSNFFFINLLQSKWYFRYCCQYGSLGLWVIKLCLCSSSQSLNGLGWYKFCMQLYVVGSQKMTLNCQISTLKMLGTKLSIQMVASVEGALWEKGTTEAVLLFKKLTNDQVLKLSTVKASFGPQPHQLHSFVLVP